MSHETDSFIDEVTEEVRRDRLFATLRRYGWIGIAAVVLIVGGAAVNEYRKAQARSAAEALGDEVQIALEQPETGERIAELNNIAVSGGMDDVMKLLVAAEELAGDDPAAAADTLRPLAQSTEAPQVFSDLAAFKLVMLGDEALDADTRAQLLQRLAQPGAPFRPLALEQLAIDLAVAGDTDAAIDAARAILQEPGLTQGVFRRMSQLMVALGAEPDDNAG